MTSVLVLWMFFTTPEAGKHVRDEKGWHYTTRDGRRVGKDCNPCREEPESGYVAPAVAGKDWKCMAKDCTPAVKKAATKK